MIIELLIIGYFMVVGIDIRILGNPVKSGIEEYVDNLLPCLVREGSGTQFKLFYSSCRNSLPDYNWLKEPNIELYKFNYPNNLLFASSRLLNRPYLDKMVKGADVFFFPHFFLSSLSPSCKRVTTFHDLSYEHFPEHLTLRKKIWHNLQMIPEWQAKFSDKIIAVSESTKNDLVNCYKIDPARIEVIYSGINEINFKISDRINWSQLAEFKKLRELPERFILFLGKLEPRKNIASIVKAFNNLKTNSKYKDVGLVIAGAKGWLYEDVVGEVNISNYKDQIVFADQIKDNERPLYYWAADVLVYPSFFEGFGFPPLEAMSCGTPVITSRNSSLPEVVSDTAIMIDPYDVAELELWITKLLDDKKLSELMAKRGLEQVSKFNWRNTAIKTLEALTKA